MIKTLLSLLIALFLTSPSTYASGGSTDTGSGIDQEPPVIGHPGRGIEGVFQEVLQDIISRWVSAGITELGGIRLEEDLLWLSQNLKVRKGTAAAQAHSGDDVTAVNQCNRYSEIYISAAKWDSETAEERKVTARHEMVSALGFCRQDSKHKVSILVSEGPDLLNKVISNEGSCETLFKSAEEFLAKGGSIETVFGDHGRTLLHKFTAVNCPNAVASLLGVDDALASPANVHARQIYNRLQPIHLVAIGSPIVNYGTIAITEHLMQAGADPLQTVQLQDGTEINAIEMACEGLRRTKNGVAGFTSPVEVWEAIVTKMKQEDKWRSRYCR